MRTFPIDFDGLRRALVAAVGQALDLGGNQVVMQEPEVAGSPRPRPPYMGIKVITAAIRHGDDAVTVVQTRTDGAQLLRYSGSRGVGLSFHSYGQSHEQAYGMMTLWQASLNAPPVQQTLRLSGISVWQIGDVRDLSLLVSTGFEGRAQMDVTFGVLSILDLWVPSIRVATADGTVNADYSGTDAVQVIADAGD